MGSGIVGVEDTPSDETGDTSWRKPRSAVSERGVGTRRTSRNGSSGGATSRPKWTTTSGPGALGPILRRASTRARYTSDSAEAGTEVVSAASIREVATIL